MISCTCQKWHPGTGCSESRDTDDQGNPIQIVDCQHYQPFDDAQDKPLTCSHCGYTGPDVHRPYRYIGGEGYVTYPRCQDEIACWERWERHQLAQIRR